MRQKNFSDNVERSSKKLYKIVSTDIKTDVKQKSKELMAVFLVTFHKSIFSKLEIKCKSGLYVSFNLGWHSIQLDQNLLSVRKVICRGSLKGWLLSLEFKVDHDKFIPSPEM